MTKVATVTFHRANNYGAVLQAYALCQYLNMTGVDGKILDYRCQSIEERYNLNVFSKGIKGWIRSLTQGYVDKKKYRKFDEFRDKFYRLYDVEDLNIVEQDIDYFIVGSDQIWNMDLTKQDMTFFLNFVSDTRKKLAYAPSFGVATLSKDKAELCKPLLQSFSNISVREPQGKELIKDLTGKEAAVVVDPVFLLTKSEWELLCAKMQKKEKYILVYLFNYSNEALYAIAELAKSSGCKIYCVDSNLRCRVKADKHIRSASPTEWLSYIRNADYVITNSFHCTAFSIIFHKLFIELPLLNGAGTGSRIENLLEISGLQGRSYNHDKFCENLDFVDWQKVEERLKPAIEKSKVYLQQQLN